MDNFLVSAETVSKKFCKSLRSSMIYGLSDIARNLVGKSSRSGELRKNEFWAVDDISFELKRGETLGIIGPNGSGKSTLLKILNGIFWPDKGKVTLKGRTAALIEVGAGFHPMLTGKENIYVNGAILGMSKEEVDKKFNAIVEFADIGEFLDTPVKHYSSGMFVRLGFAIAVHCDPDILLIDEVLSVGDVGFRSKCYNKIAEICKNTSVVFVSHNMVQIARVCSRVLVLKDGKAVHLGSVREGIDIYNSFFNYDLSVRTGSGKAKIYRLDFINKNGEKTNAVDYNDYLCIEIEFQVEKAIKHPVIFVGFYNKELQCVAELNSFFNGTVIESSGEQTVYRISVEHLILNPGKYAVTCCIYDDKMHEHLAWHFACWEIEVQGSRKGMNAVQLAGKWEKKNEIEI